MKCLTICQPYAELILLREKRVENRTWSIPHCGPLLIHAGKSEAWLASYTPLPAYMDFGCLVGICELVACFPARALRAQKVPQRYWDLAKHIHVEGPYCAILESVVRFTSPVKYRGMQGLFEVEGEIVVAALHALVAEGKISREMAERFLR